MSRNLAKILAKEEAEVTKDLSRLEEKCGNPSEDVRLLVENKHNLRSKTEQLGLDADDSTDEELYYALGARFERDSQMLDRALGVGPNTKFDERLNKAIQLVNLCAQPDEMWVVKNSVARSALAKNPPKHVAKQIRYRSVASMIKREDTAEIYLAGSVIESATWQKNVSRHLGRQNAAQYELRPIKLVNLKPARWGGVNGPASYVIIDERVGAVAVWPSDDLNNASVLCLTLLLLEGMQSLNPGGYSEALHELSPALRWWADTAHLISDGERPVSFNLKDVSFNHLKKHQLNGAVRHHGAHSLWSELTARYQKISESLSDKAADVESELNKSTNQPHLPAASELAAEYASLEQ